MSSKRLVSASSVVAQLVQKRKALCVSSVFFQKLNV